MPWKHLGPEMVEALKAGDSLPPVVVVAGENGWVLLDGAHRTHAHWTLRRQTILANELLTEDD